MSSLGTDQKIQLCLGINDMLRDNARSGDTKTMSNGVVYFEVLMLNHFHNSVNGIIDFQILEQKLFFNFKEAEMVFLFRYPQSVLFQNSNTQPTNLAPINPAIN
jgi:hypothetical protein